MKQRVPFITAVSNSVEFFKRVGQDIIETYENEKRFHQLGKDIVVKTIQDELTMMYVFMNEIVHVAIEKNDIDCNTISWMDDNHFFGIARGDVKIAPPSIRRTAKELLRYNSGGRENIKLSYGYQVGL